MYNNLVHTLDTSLIQLWHTLETSKQFNDYKNIPESFNILVDLLPDSSDL